MSDGPEPAALIYRQTCLSSKSIVPGNVPLPGFSADAVAEAAEEAREEADATPDGAPELAELRMLETDTVTDPGVLNEDEVASLVSFCVVVVLIATNTV